MKKILFLLALIVSVNAKAASMFNEINEYNDGGLSLLQIIIIGGVLLAIKITYDKHKEDKNIK